MLFHNYPTLYSWGKKDHKRSGKSCNEKYISPEVFYQRYGKYNLQKREEYPDDIQTSKDLVQGATEWAWFNEKRPFYNIYPAILPMIKNTSLELSPKHIHDILSQDSFSLSAQFSEGSHIDIGNFRGLRSILFGADFNDNGFTICSYTDFGLVTSKKDMVPDNLVTQMTLPKQYYTKNITEIFIEEQNQNFKTALDSGSSVGVFTIQILIVLLLLKDNPEIITPVVLKTDEIKYNKSRDIKYVKKARRRGVNGFDVGKDIKISPHFRRPHFAIRWTGQGRKLPKLVPVVGCVVHRNKLEKVPTGYLDQINQ